MGWLNPLITLTIVLTYGGLLLVTFALNPFLAEPADCRIRLHAVVDSSRASGSFGGRCLTRHSSARRRS